MYDLSACTIRVPAGADRLPLYDFLSGCFPGDRPLFDEVTRSGKTLYTWTPYTLYRGNEILGNVSLMPIRVWLGGRATPVVGVASVATAPQYRRQGVARHLLQHALGLIDRQGAPCVLFTGLPEAYQALGFEIVPQCYLAARPSPLTFPGGPFDRELLASLSDGQLPALAAIYAEQYPNYDGKVARDPDYWRFYATLFNLSGRSRLLLCAQQGAIGGYARFERDDDRLTICEFCARASAADIAEALLGALREQAFQWDVDLLSFALPPDHFAWPVLQRHAVALDREPPGVVRETFMVRPGSGARREALFRLPWSLADKF